jgi:hypothetical protein
MKWNRSGRMLNPMNEASPFSGKAVEKLKSVDIVLSLFFDSESISKCETRMNSFWVKDRLLWTRGGTCFSELLLDLPRKLDVSVGRLVQGKDKRWRSRFGGFVGNHNEVWQNKMASAQCPFSADKVHGGKENTSVVVCKS